MTSFMLRLKSPTAIFFACLTVISIIIGVCSHSYFTEQIFTVNGNHYRLYAEQNGTAIYHARDALPIEVSNLDQKRGLRIGDEAFTVARTESSEFASTIYKVEYAGGKTYEVEDHSGFMLTRDDEGEIVMGLQTYVNDKRVLDENEEYYTPVSLVTAAFPAYHHAQGTPFYLFLALGIMIYGWTAFRYEKFQNLLFFVSFRWVWVQDPEPSDFYYFMTKAGGVFCMLFSIYVAALAFQ